MRKTLSSLVICAGLIAAAAPARADLAVGAGVGTLGFGVNVAAEVNSFLALRLNGNLANFDVPSFGVYPTDFGDISYDVEGDYQTVGILADFHPLGISPLGSGLVLVGGVYYNQNEFTATTGPITATVGGSPAPQSVDLVGTIAFEDFAPYLAIGYDSTFHSLLPVSFYARAGVLFQGSPSVTLVDRLGNASQPDLDAEARQMENDLSGYEYYPVFSLGLMVSF